MKILFLILATLLGARGSYKEYKNQKIKGFWNKLFFGLGVIVTIGLATLSIIEIIDENNLHRINALSGNFGSQKDASLPSPWICIGGNYSHDNLFPVYFGDSRIKPLDIKTSNGQILFYTHIRDSRGELVATVNGREWEINNPSAIEYNNDKYAFEISYGGQVIFQVEFRKDTVFCNGLICAEAGGCMVASPESGIQQTPVFQKIMPKFLFPPNYNLIPIFKYPRRKYLGKRNDGLDPEYQAY